MMKYIPLFITLFSALSLLGQDAHFSQWRLMQQYNNPAAMGQMPSTSKLALNYRSQWASIPDAYRTIGAAFEQKVKFITLGASILHQDAGKSSLRNTNIQLQAALNKRISSSGHSISAGFYAGFIQQRFQPELLQFDNQYQEGTGFNAQLPSQETFTKTSHLLPDFGAGFQWNGPVGNAQASIGLSIMHLNRAAASFYNDASVMYPVKTSINGSLLFTLSTSWKMQVNLAWFKQQPASKQLAGLQFQYLLSEHKAWRMGVASRFKDAVIFEVGMDFKRSAFTLSYDLNYSSLALASQHKGAIELGAVFYFNRPSKKPAHPTAEIPNPAPIEKEIITPNINSLDRDKDGILDSIDHCPLLYGSLMLAGCPDFDKDGIPDNLDQCPHLAGHKENDGCPTKTNDTDMDGVLDHLDDCPFLKGSAAMKGCPDTDLDGVSDIIDQCPFLKGEKAQNGCPLSSSSNRNQVGIQQDILIGEVVEFDTDEAVVKSIYFSRLKKLANHLNNNPSQSAFIAGHTDNEGNSYYNLQLSEKRSQAVMEFLIRLGVSSNQMMPVTYGESKPIQRNTTPFGKARNRRVEIVVTQ